ncbi:MAG: signal recognition particle-docking protein FtsY [Deferribacteraceae bacterium]|nr:signal recognition particle-docking protein FtsY [Deferribacteraceae bacterium]
MQKTSRQITSIFSSPSFDENFWEELFEQMVLTDMGAALAQDMVAAARKARDADKVLEILKDQIVSLFPPIPSISESENNIPKVVLVVGVNGTGKTTTAAKLADKAVKSGKKVCLAAADTFRAAAIEQLKSWADRLGCHIIAPKAGSDPAACSYDAVIYGVKNGCDAVIIDTAGRLHTKENLMQELRKIVRVCGSAHSGAPHESLLVLDGGSGQNALNQARVFREMIGVTDIAVTKLDGTAKGGVVLRIASELKIPVKYIGVGETSEDLLDFEPESFADAILSR